MNADWIYLVLGKNKEQINGLESIGSIVKDTAEDSTPMDDDSEGGNIDNTTTPPEDDTPPSDEESTMEPDTTDTEDTMGDGNGGDGELGTSSKDESKDPDLDQNRLILLSSKLVSLYWSIRDSMDNINESSSFEKKPVTLDELARLADIVLATNNSINRVSDYKIIMLRYTTCVKTYNKILNVI